MPTTFRTQHRFSLRVALGMSGLLVAALATGCAAPVAPAVATPAAAAEEAAAPETTTAPAEEAAVPEATAALAEAPAEAPAGMPALPAGGLGQGGPGLEMETMVAPPTAQDVAYASLSETQKLDLYIPEGDGPFPVVLNLHPGGFMVGDKSNPAAGDTLLANGYAVASIDYRLSAEATAPAQIEDAKAAVRWLRANAEAYGLDPQRIAAFGQSAGGNLAALLGTSCGAADIEGAELGNAEQSSCVQAVVDWFGPIDFLQMDSQFAGTSCPANHEEATSPESMVIGGPIQENPELVAQVNPITYVSVEAPPFLIQHGTADCNVPAQQSQLLYEALVPAIGAENVTLTFIDGAGHGGPQFTEAANLELLVAFLDQHLK